MAQDHDLKCQPPHFAKVWIGIKTAEIRLNDRGYQRGDTLTLREWWDGEYTGAWVQLVVTDLLTGWGLQEGYVMLSFDFLRNSWPDVPKYPTNFEPALVR